MLRPNSSTLEPVVTNEHFSVIGEQFGLSDDGRFMVFYGVLNGTGASALPGATQGPGLFASVRQTDGGRRLVQLYRPLANAAIEVGAFSAHGRVAINALGVGHDDYLVAFMGSDLSGRQAIFAARLTQIESDDRYTAGPVSIVAGVGRRLRGSNLMVEELNLDDGVSSNGQIAFWALTDQGERIVKAQEPRRPIFVVPGIFASYARDMVHDDSWLLGRGSRPEALQIEPLTLSYHDMILSLQRSGYVMDRDLFVATYDWRLNPGPLDGLIHDPQSGRPVSYDNNKLDGKIDGLCAGTVGGNCAWSITDERYEWGVDYLGYYLKRATESWAQRFGAESSLDKVDVVVHSTGGLVARVYIQSDAYNKPFQSAALGRELQLPRIGRFFSIGVPHRGASKAWNVLHDNWNLDIPFKLVISKVLNRVADLMKKGGIVTGPGHPPFSSGSGPNDVNLTTQAGREAFISRYVPTIRSLLATYSFHRPRDPFSGEFCGADALQTINCKPLERNNLVLDLNNGLDRLTQLGDSGLFEHRDPNLFVAEIDEFYAIAGIDQKTPLEARHRVGPIPSQISGVAETINPFDEFTDRAGSGRSLVGGN